VGPLLVILKLAGQQCNLDCLYCYERRKPAGRGHLDPAVLQDFLTRIEGTPIRALLHGGEPLLVTRHRMSELLDILNGYSALEGIAIQTNGTLLDEEWVRLLNDAAKDIEWGISYDGTAGLSEFRQTYRGDSSWADTARGIQVLEDMGMPYGLITVVTRAHLTAGSARRLADSVEAFTQMRSLKLVPCFDGPATAANQLRTVSGERQRNLLRPQANPLWSVEPHEFARFVDEFQSEWLEREAWRRYRLDPITSLVENLRGRRSAYSDFNDNSDADVVTLYPDGTIAANDRANEVVSGEVSLAEVADIRAYIEDIRESMRSEWLRDYADVCSSCEVYDGCRGSELFTRRQMRLSGREDAFCDSRKEMVGKIRGLLDRSAKVQAAGRERMGQ